jgi:hypothetical protein
MIISQKLISTLLMGICFFMFMSCGKSTSSSEPVVRLEQQQQLDDQGNYTAVLRSLNSEIAGEAQGSVEIKIEGDDFLVEAQMSNSPAGVMHLQNIMSGTKCPDVSADTNGDNIIDISETLIVSGEFLIPLDSDLSEQIDGSDFGPIANDSGSYFYRRSTSLSRVLADLQAPDPDPADSIVKIPQGDNLNLNGKVILVHGVHRNTSLPATVGTISGRSAEQLLPIACGVLVRKTIE